MMLNEFSKTSKIILFFDEMPWLASNRSNFLSALDYFWNRHASRMGNILLIVCGSAASWMIHNVINNKGGLYGRLSAQMRLLPFKLAEVELFLKKEGIDLSRKQICELYLVTGGLPKYLSHLPRGNSAAQLIHLLCFTPQAPLLTEFHKLYHSLFSKPELHIAIIKALAKTKKGLSRKELNQSINGETSRATSKILEELEESGFIARLLSWGKKLRIAYLFLLMSTAFFILIGLMMKSTLFCKMKTHISG